ncbi:MAG: zinc ribbon domain-containing protein [Candidatus Heimdallarchaeota archaeon]|nr:zinc ribbon domain-containing protein [Candidatus Heimdallarchaeota archaeon]
MSVTCPNCGLLNEDDSKFCSQCGYQLPAVDSHTSSEFIPPASTAKPTSSPDRSSSKPVIFVSKGRSSRHHFPSRRRSRPRRHQHSGWIMGVVFLGIGLLFTALILAPLFLGISYNSMTDLSDFGTSMGHMGSDLGDFFGNIGERIGDFFGGLGERLGNFFGSFGDNIGHSFDSGFSFAFIPVFFLSLFPILFILIAFIAILRSARINRQSL